MELVDGLKEEEQEEDVQPGGQEEGDAEAAAETDAAAEGEGEGEGDADDAAASEEQLAEEAQLRRDKEQANKKKVRHTLRTLDGITSQTTTQPEDAGAVAARGAPFLRHKFPAECARLLVACFCALSCSRALL